MSEDNLKLQDVEQDPLNSDNVNRKDVEHQAPQNDTTDGLDIKYIYSRDKLIRTVIQPSIYLDAEIFELLKEVSYRDGIDDPDRLTTSQLESFAKSAIYEKIDRSLEDYGKLGQNYSGRLQRKYKHLVTLKEISDPESIQGSVIVPRYSEQQKSAGKTQALSA